MIENRKQNHRVVAATLVRKSWTEIQIKFGIVSDELALGSNLGKAIEKSNYFYQIQVDNDNIEPF